MEICLQCNSEIKAKNWLGSPRKFCSKDCRITWRRLDYQKLNSGKNPLLKNRCSVIGAIHELEACADLMKRGYEVYRAVSASANCDLVVLKDNKLLRVEVTTGKLYGNGKIYYPPKTKQIFDVLAVVIYGGPVHYFPDLK